MKKEYKKPEMEVFTIKNEDTLDKVLEQSAIYNFDPDEVINISNKDNWYSKGTE